MGTEWMGIQLCATMKAAVVGPSDRDLTPQALPMGYELRNRNAAGLVSIILSILLPGWPNARFRGRSAADNDGERVTMA